MIWQVCESGEGFTLSGKPLDPHSAAARAYGALRKPTNGQPLTEEQLKNRVKNDALLKEQQAKGIVSRQKVVVTSPEEQAAIDKRKADAKAAKEAAKAKSKALVSEWAFRARVLLSELCCTLFEPEPLSHWNFCVTQAAEARERKRVERELAAARRAQAKASKSSSNDQSLYGADGRTEYSRRRGRRAAATKFQSRMKDSFSFVRCQCYHGGTALAGSGVLEAQPFKVTINASASTVSIGTFVLYPALQHKNTFTSLSVTLKLLLAD